MGLQGVYAGLWVALEHLMAGKGMPFDGRDNTLGILELAIISELNNYFSPPCTIAA
jgi:hypothetical protein